MKRALGFVLVTVAALWAVGCGGDPLTIWKVQGIAGTKDPSCYKGGKVTDTSSVTTTAQTYIGDWEMYTAAGGKYELHLGPVKLGANPATNTVLVGAVSGGKYTFDGLTNDIVMTGDPAAPTTTVTSSYHEVITLTMSGGTFTGTWSHDYSVTCAGTCPATFSDDNPSCTITDTISGTQIPVTQYHAE